MPCDEWRGLIERYRGTVYTYNEAVKALGVRPGAAFNEIWQRAERARVKCDRSRADLLHHEHEHACLEVLQPVGHHQMSEIDSESLVLGDQGQSGG
jgi:hypothetical protein